MTSCFRVLALLSLAVIAGLSTARSAVAAPQTGVSSYKTALTQVDGITNAVIDKLNDATDTYWHDGDYNRIVGLFRVIVEADPGFVEAFSSAGWILWSMGDTSGADAMLAKGVAANPTRYDLYTDFGGHLYRTKRYAQALPYLQKGASFPNSPGPAFSTLGHCYERLGRIDDAIKTWQALVKKHPTFVSGPPNLKRVLAMKASGTPRR